jgi:hypothetical protein
MDQRMTLAGSLHTAAFRLFTIILVLRTHPLAEGTGHPRPAFPAPSTQPRFAFPDETLLAVIHTTRNCARVW